MLVNASVKLFVQPIAPEYVKAGIGLSLTVIATNIESVQPLAFVANNFTL